MEITGVKIQKVFDDESSMLKAIASITIDNMIAIHDIRLLKTAEKVFVAMPNRKLGDGTYKDVTHPINAEGRRMIECAVIPAYEDYIASQNTTEATE